MLCCMRNYQMNFLLSKSWWIFGSFWVSFLLVLSSNIVIGMWYGASYIKLRSTKRVNWTGKSRKKVTIIHWTVSGKHDCISDPLWCTLFFFISFVFVLFFQALFVQLLGAISHTKKCRTKSNCIVSIASDFIFAKFIRYFSIFFSIAENHFHIDLKFQSAWCCN